MIETIVIEIGLPPKELNPNARPHYMAKARAKKLYRLEANLQAQNALYRMSASADRPMWDSATIQVEYRHKTKRMMDTDNILASLKAAFDGLVDAGILTDDKDIAYMPVVRSTDRTNPGVRITVYRPEKTRG